MEKRKKRKLPPLCVDIYILSEALNQRGAARVALRDAIMWHRITYGSRPGRPREDDNEEALDFVIFKAQEIADEGNRPTKIAVARRCAGKFGISPAGGEQAINRLLKRCGRSWKKDIIPAAYKNARDTL
jgi:hypothetical protein